MIWNLRFCLEMLGRLLCSVYIALVPTTDSNAVCTPALKSSSCILCKLRRYDLRFRTCQLGNCIQTRENRRDKMTARMQLTRWTTAGLVARVHAGVDTVWEGC